MTPPPERDWGGVGDEARGPEPVTDPPRAPRTLVSVEALVTLLGEPAMEGIVWRPWTDDRSIGYEITLPGGEIRYLRIEPSPDRTGPHADVLYGTPGSEARIARITLSPGDGDTPLT